MFRVVINITSVHFIDIKMIINLQVGCSGLITLVLINIHMLLSSAIVVFNHLN